jgi:WD40 repeat protein
MYYHMQNRDLYQWMRAPSAIYKSDTFNSAPERRACTKGTRVDVLGRIVDWASDPSSPPIFWLSGLAGTGKSTIAYTVCDYFDKESLPARLGASFFCSRQVADLRCHQNIIPTLAYQLARVSRSFAEGLASADPLSVHVSRDQMEKLLVDPWQQTVHIRPVELPSSLVVIDALDEIDGDGGEKLLRELIEATKKTMGGMLGLKVLVTSRPHPKIVAATSPLSLSAVYRLEDITEGQEDVRNYLTEALPELETRFKQSLDDLATLSDGLFIFAATAVRLISPPEYPLSAKEKVRRLSRFLHGWDALSSDSEAGLGIDTLYAQIIHDAVPRQYRASRLPLLHNIICSLQPLSIPVHAELIAVSSDDKDEEAAEHLIGALHAVLYIRDGRVYTHHKSFSDFILDERRCGHELACVPAGRHLLLSLGCFRVMMASLHFNICSLPSSYLLDSEIENLVQLVEENILCNPGLAYACRYWTSHLVKVPNTSDDVQHLLGKLLDFSYEKIIFWIEAMSLLSEKEVCHDGLISVAAWVNKAVSNFVAMSGSWLMNEQLGVTAELQTTLTAVSMLAKSFLRTAASSSTPHLYITSLATEFATNPGIPSQWKSLFPGVPRICCTGVSNHGGVLSHINVESEVVSVVFSPDGTRVVSGSYDGSVRIWDASTGSEVRSLEGHTDLVNSVAFSADGRHIVSGSYDRSVRIWDAATGMEVRTLEGHTSSVHSVAFSTDCRHIVSGSDDRSVRIWDASTGEEVRTLEGHTSAVNSVAFSADGRRIVSGSDDRSVRIWDASTGAEVRMLERHTYDVNSVAFSADGRRIVSGSDDRFVRIWDALTGAEVRTLDGHTSLIHSVAFSTDDRHIVSGSDDESVRIWDASTGAEVRTLEGHKSPVNSVAFSADGTRIVSGSYDGSVRIWDAATGVEVRKLEGHTSLVHSVAFSTDGRRIVSGSDDKSVRVWDASTGEEVHTLEGHTSAVNSVAFSADGRHIVSGSDDRSVRIWDASTGTEVCTLKGHMSPVNSVPFSAGSMRVVSGSVDQSVRTLYASTGADVRTLEGHTYDDNSAALSIDGARIVSGSCDGFVRIWDASTGAEVRKLEGRTGWVRSVAFSADGGHIASGSDDESMRMLYASTRADVGTLEGHTSIVNSVAFSADGTHIVSGSKDRSVRIYNTSTGAEVCTLEGRTLPFKYVAFSVDSTRVVLGSYDKSIRIWDTLTRAEVCALGEHKREVNSVALTSDSTRIVSGSGDGSVSIRNASTGKVRTLEGHTDSVTSVAFSFDGRYVVSGCYDGSVRIWDASDLEELHELDWKLGSAGWVVTESSQQRLLWFPSQLHLGLRNRYCTVVISRVGYTTIDFSRACVGPDWARCYRQFA